MLFFLFFLFYAFPEGSQHFSQTPYAYAAPLIPAQPIQTAATKPEVTGEGKFSSIFYQLAAHSFYCA
jgi:hypothetical protein